MCRREHSFDCRLSALNLGSGRQAAVPGLVRVDRVLGLRPDVVCDLNHFPWPFRNDSFERIVCMDILEHIQDLMRAMSEIHRIGKPDCIVEIATPHFSCRNAFTDPTHFHFLGIRSFDYFSANETIPDFSKWSYYSPSVFAKRGWNLEFEKTFVNRFVARFARRYPDYWESRLAWIFPAWFMTFELAVIKP